MLITAQYQPVSFFSLRPANATSSGGKTLLVPTPFAIKMALLSTAIQSRGLAEGERLFPFLRDLDLFLEPPQELIILKSFSKIRRELKDKNNPEKAQRARDEKEFPLQPTIAYREYVNYRGSLQLACQLDESNPLVEILPDLLLQINYLGKRGGFLQILESPQYSDKSPAGDFVHLTAPIMHTYSTHGTLQMLDDCGAQLTFDKANIYSTAKIVLHKDRILRHIVLPYEQIRSSRSYSWYQRFSETPDPGHEIVLSKL
ncbi:hypothetical protein [Dictyobacter arantiisoli]|uniref:CRISPR-associated protein Cas5 n=1 Tax=Dictyobacter arantiisoli TaxID=2014874 RepID=A0A5A5TIU0_9CHLR|nr:hypothetical protein [Dictyobacter arantiisoli]GCF11252.1 hypothetical protein KDI_48160 [Dictyobacter arantiisoli]